ncbi:MAG: hypothetical protein ACKOWF_14260 [Chloroflexota bacterium]
MVHHDPATTLRAAALAGLLVAGITGHASGARQTDPLAPDLGHAGYDTISAAIALDLDVPAGAIRSGSAGIAVIATTPLRAIGFDLRDGLTVDACSSTARPPGSATVATILSSPLRPPRKRAMRSASRSATTACPAQVTIRISGAGGPMAARSSRSANRAARKPGSR